MSYKAHVFLCVLKCDDPRLVTQIAGLEPTEAWMKGDPIKGNSGPLRNHSRWALKSPLKSESPVEDQLDALITILESHASGIQAVLARFPTSIWCAMYCKSANPVVRFSDRLLARIAALHLPMDLDVYFIRENQTNEYDQKSVTS